MQGLNIDGEVWGEKYPCIVCLLETNSIQELHDHQKCNHTTAELSLSVICLVHFMCVRNQALSLDLASNCPSLSINHPTTHHHFSPSCYNQLHTAGSNDCAIHNPSVPCASGTNHETQSFLGKTCRPAKVHEQASLVPIYSLISRRGLGSSDQPLFNTEGLGPDPETRFITSLELELSKVPEISDDTFLKCVDEICKDLEFAEKPAATRRQGAMKSTGHTKRGTNRKPNGKRRACPKSKIILAFKRTGNKKGLRRSQTHTESPVRFDCRNQQAVPIDYSSTHSDAKSVDKKSKKTGKEFEQAPSIEGISEVENTWQDFSNQQELREMPVLEAQIVESDACQ